MLYQFLVVLAALTFAEPNPPTWPPNVYVFDPANSSQTQQIVDTVYAQNGGHNPPNNGQWSNSRYAFLFKPGTHSVTVNVGYYTSVYGLSLDPQSTNIEAVVCENGDYDYTTGALDNFWRSAEGFYTKPTQTWNGNVCMLWAASQASPLRRIYIDGNLQLWEYNSGCCAGYASGGYLSGSTITGQISSGSQQQYYFRNVDIGSWNGGVWNMVFQGSPGAPNTQCVTSGGQPFTTTGVSPIIAEKPYITINTDGTYNLIVPPVEYNKYGPTTDYSKYQSRSFSNVYVATQSDSASTINSKISSGLDVILTAGNYNLNGPIIVNRANATILGIGFPTLISTSGNVLIQVGDYDGVRISGPILLQAGQTKSTTLLQWGSGNYAGNRNNPGFIHDVFARVGGTNDPSQYQVSTDSMVSINNGYVIFDGTWLWRADHDVSGTVYNGDNPVSNGLIVNGDNVITYGLAVEHTLEDLVVWNGDNGQMYFYQSEFPYDVTSAYGTSGYTSVRIKGTNMLGTGVGSYSYFRDYDVTVNSGIVTGSSVNFTNSLSIFLNGNGGITHVINNNGNSVHSGATEAYVCSDIAETKSKIDIKHYHGDNRFCTNLPDVICNNYDKQPQK